VAVSSQQTPNLSSSDESHAGSHVAPSRVPTESTVAAPKWGRPCALEPPPVGDRALGGHRIGKRRHSAAAVFRHGARVPTRWLPSAVSALPTHTGPSENRLDAHAPDELEPPPWCCEGKRQHQTEKRNRPAASTEILQRRAHRVCISESARIDDCLDAVRGRVCAYGRAGHEMLCPIVAQARPWWEKQRACVEIDRPRPPPQVAGDWSNPPAHTRPTRRKRRSTHLRKEAPQRRRRIHRAAHGAVDSARVQSPQLATSESDAAPPSPPRSQKHFLTWMHLRLAQ